VLGPSHDFVLPVAAAGSRYLAIPQVSAADWARWLQVIEPRTLASAPLDANYLIWRADDAPPPREILCKARLIDTFEPPPATFPSLSWYVEDDPYAVYPKMRLYALDEPCGDIIKGS
jgi:hypothetical protein